MSEEIKVAKINGKFVITAALITGVCTIISSVISNNAGKEKAVNEVIAQTTDSININSIDELISKYNQLNTDNLNLKDENIALSANNIALKEQNNSLLTENESLKTELAQYDSFEENYNNLITENDSLKSELEQLNNELQELKDNNTSENEVTNEPEPVTNTGKKVSIFDLDTFRGDAHWYTRSSLSDSYFVDTYDNEYPNAHLGHHTSRNKDRFNSQPTYLLNKEYSTCM